MKEATATKKLGLIFSIVIVLLCAGCWSQKEPKDLAIINSIIYDNTQDGQCRVVVEFMDFSASKDGGGGSKKSFITQTAYGSTYREALANVSQSIDKVIFGGHNQVRFFTEAAAKKDMVVALDYFLRDHLTDETPLMVVIKADEPDKIYSSSLGLSDSMGVYISSLSETQPKNTSKSVFVTTLQFVKDFLSDGKQPVAGVVQISENEDGSQESEGRIVFEGLAAFKGNKLAGYFDGVEARAYNFITNNIGGAFISIPSGESETLLEITGASTDIKTTLDCDAVKLDVHINVKMRVITEGSDIDVSQEDALKSIEARFNQQLMPEIMAAIGKAQQEFKSDIFGFGNAVHSQHPQEWKQMKGEWDNLFAGAAVSITVDSKAYQTGEIKNSLSSEESK